jgi:hypothetical protein
VTEPRISIPASSFGYIMAVLHDYHGRCGGPHSKANAAPCPWCDGIEFSVEPGSVATVKLPGRELAKLTRQLREDR